jgi:hypothetical protein
VVTCAVAMACPAPGASHPPVALLQLSPPRNGLFPSWGSHADFMHVRCMKEYYKTHGSVGGLPAPPPDGRPTGRPPDDETQATDMMPVPVFPEDGEAHATNVLDACLMLRRAGCFVQPSGVRIRSRHHGPSPRGAKCALSPNSWPPRAWFSPARRPPSERRAVRRRASRTPGNVGV